MSVRLPGRRRARRTRRRPVTTAIELRYVEEQEPLGTAGAVKHAESLLDERFLVLNGDVLADLDLSAEMRPARTHRGAGHARAGAGRRPHAPTAWS